MTQGSPNAPVSTVRASEMSIVFQGPVVGASRDPGARTAECIRRARRVFPDAEILLSTWAGADTAGFEVDAVITSDDPGAWVRDDGVPCNCNRQRASTLAGLARAQRRFAVKIRTDTTFTHAGMLELPARLPPRPVGWRIFAERIVVLEKFTRDPARSSLLHFVSDLFQFGLREDLLRLWDVPPAREEDYRGWSKGWAPLVRAPFPDHRTFMRHADEQYVWLSCLRKNGVAVDLDYLSQCRLGEISQAEGLMVANFAVRTAEEAGVELPARFRDWAYPETCLDAREWDRLAHIYGAGREAPQAVRRAQVWLGARMHLARMAAGRFRPAYLLRSRFGESHPLRVRYRRAKARLKGLRSGG